MTNARDPTALGRHAALVGDRRLVVLLTQVPTAPVTERPAFAPRAYGTLVARLSLGEPGNYDHP